MKENSSVGNGLMSELSAECSSCSEAEHKTATKVLMHWYGLIVRTKSSMVPR